MGWFWDTKPRSGGDATSKLDPSLQDFLSKESSSQAASSQPVAIAKETPRSAEGASTTYRSQLGLPTSPNNPSTTAEQPSVPAESLYQDGRYAHLWTTYRPQTAIEASGKTDQDRLADVVDVYRDRKAAIGRAALENCVMEQIAEAECFSHGGWKKMMGMCRTENKAFNRCYTMQSRFLKALGYLSNEFVGPEEEEKIQMHADRLYHEMLAREKAIAEATEKGVEVPTFAPLLQTRELVHALGEESAFAKARERAREEALPTNLSSYPPEKQDEIQGRLKGLSEWQKEVELQLIAAESRAQLVYADKVREEKEAERVTRASRRERGKETVGDTIKKAWGWEQ